MAEGETLNHYVPRSDMEDSVILLSFLLQALPSNAIGSGFVSHLIWMHPVGVYRNGLGCRSFVNETCSRSE